MGRSSTTDRIQQYAAERSAARKANTATALLAMKSDELETTVQSCDLQSAVDWKHAQRQQDLEEEYWQCIAAAASLAELNHRLEGIEDSRCARDDILQYSRSGQSAEWVLQHAKNQEEEQFLLEQQEIARQRMPTRSAQCTTEYVQTSRRGRW